MAPVCVAAPGSALNVRTLTGAHRGPRSLGRPPGQLLRGPGVQGQSRRGRRRGPWALPLPLARPTDNRAPLAHTASAESDHKGVFGEAGGRRLVASWASSACGFQACPGMGCRWEGGLSKGGGDLKDPGCGEPVSPDGDQLWGQRGGPRGHSCPRRAVGRCGAGKQLAGVGLLQVGSQPRGQQGGESGALVTGKPQSDTVLPGGRRSASIDPHTPPAWQVLDEAVAAPPAQRYPWTGPEGGGSEGDSHSGH